MMQAKNNIKQNKKVKDCACETPLQKSSFSPATALEKNT
jgi:hypothetical protein